MSITSDDAIGRIRKLVNNLSNWVSARDLFADIYDVLGQTEPSEPVPVRSAMDKLRDFNLKSFGALWLQSDNHMRSALMDEHDGLLLEVVKERAHCSARGRSIGNNQNKTGE